MIIYFLSTTFIILLQAVFLPLNAVLLALVVGVTYFPNVVWPATAFGLGVILDLFGGRVLGTSSLLFLGMTFILWVYGRKWSLGHPVFLFAFCFGADFVCHLFWGQPFLWAEGLVVGIAAGIWGWWLGNTQGSGKMKLGI